MVFVAGALVGGVLGFGAAILLQRGRAGPRPTERRAFATGVAVVALLVSALALANSQRHTSPRGAATGPTSATARTALVSTTAAVTAPSGPVRVPNVIGLARAAAVRALEDAGLRVSIDTLALTSVPPDFVLSQIPLPAAATDAGATVALVVSSAG